MFWEHWDYLHTWQVRCSCCAKSSHTPPLGSLALLETRLVTQFRVKGRWWLRNRCGQRWSPATRRTLHSLCPPTTNCARESNACWIKCTASRGASPNQLRAAHCLLLLQVWTRFYKLTKKVQVRIHVVTLPNTLLYSDIRAGNHASNNFSSCWAASSKLSERAVSLPPQFFFMETKPLLPSS